MSYDPYKSTDKMTKDDFMDMFTLAVMNHEFDLMDGALDILTEYYNKTKRLVFITHRNTDTVRPTKDFIMKRIKLPYEMYACYKCEKSSVAKDLGATGIVDDLPSICQEFIDNGMDALLFKAPWHCHETVNPDIKTVTNWNDIAKIIL
jgi:hypothetical protein